MKKNKVNSVFVKRYRKFGLSVIFLSLIGLTGSGCESSGMQSSATTSSHYAGTDCLASGCHASGENAITIAGTLYTDSTGSTTVTGGIVTVSNGSDTVDIESDLNGNFYIYDTRFSSGTLSTSTSNGTMSTLVSFPSAGACNSCHGGATGANLTNVVY